MTTTVGQEKQLADVFVVFGITGDLAKVMTFRSLYRLEARGLLEWDVDQLVQRARESIEGRHRADQPATAPDRTHGRRRHDE